jgi:hypothetical protein
MGLAELLSQTKKHAQADGTAPTAIPFLWLIRASTPTALRSGILEPSICLVVQGEKRLLVGREAHRYGAGSYCMSALEFPTAGKVVTAPYRAIRIVLDVREIAQIILDGEIEAAPPPRECCDASNGCSISWTSRMHPLSSPRRRGARSSTASSRAQAHR